jgi:hypothetical protein
MINLEEEDVKDVKLFRKYKFEYLNNYKNFSLDVKIILDNNISNNHMIYQLDNTKIYYFYI